MIKQPGAAQTTGDVASPAESTGLVTPNALIRASVSVLNPNYVPVNVCSVRRVAVMLSTGKAVLLDNHQCQLHTVTTVIEPLRLVYMVRRPFLRPRLSKKEVFLRDRFTCQYCGNKVQDLTLDHAISREQNGSHTWENVVAVCNRCNLHKAGRTPVEAKMFLA